MDKLRFIAISGTTSVTENMYLYEYDNQILVVDCGVGFPAEAAFGVDLVIPDFSYVVQNKDKVRAVIVSHGHEDHLGALPFLFQNFQVPVYSTALVAGFIEDKFADYGQKVKVNIFDPEKDRIKIGSFIIDSFRISHSVPDSVGFCITTPVGRVFHVPDYKFDWTPVDQKPFDVAKAARLAADGVLAMASDCLGSTSEGYTNSERDIEKTIELVIGSAKKKIYFTTLSSNISRMQQAIKASELVGRKVAFIGRSTEKKIEIAKRLGIIKWNQGTVINPREGQKLPDGKITYIISGAYGQLGSALYRVAHDEHPLLKVSSGDVVVFSADPAPPGTGQAVDHLVDLLIEKGAEVHYYDTQEDLHVSGHGSQKDIEMLLSLVRPKYLLPIGGTIRHMRAYTKLAETMGWKKETVFELKAGDIIELTHDSAAKSESIPVRSVLVDGLGIGDVGNVVLRDRKTLAKEGVVVVILQIDKVGFKLASKPDVISRGFVFAKENQDLLNHASAELTKRILPKLRQGDEREVKEIAIDFLERFFFEQTGRRPMILPVVVEV